MATDARPEQIRDLFGQKQTLAIGAAFGVITVRGPRKAGMIEVATFRQDAAYSDGRHPDHVTFSSAREDAVRRDFTINGMFFDPLEGRVIDFVGGQEDLARRVIRADRAAAERFAEDKLRMLRAVRFSAAFGFALEAETRRGDRPRWPARSAVVSPERIAMEMGRMLIDPGRGDAVRLLLETGLAAAVLPEIVPADDLGRQRLDRALAILGRLEHPGFPLALATLLCGMADATAGRQVCRRWRLSNHETGRVVWLLEHRADLAGAPDETLVGAPAAAGLQGDRRPPGLARGGRAGGGRRRGLLPVAPGTATGGVGSAAFGDRRRPAGARRAGRSQVPFPFATNP